ncbi:hypothetical protein LCGC14_1377630 [marine sediment metagenome]|uniref:Uncharacterized protein n=1 Tax=marine sediment metagenome TaxID=412755 RepID=A0A0F9MIX6_9ZZZZ
MNEPNIGEVMRLRRIQRWRDSMSDGCSSAPDHGWWGNHRWACVAHDREYYYGGSARRRRRADQTFRDNLRAAGMPGVIAWIYYLAVRAFGHPRFKRPYSWAFGAARYRYDEYPASPPGADLLRSW